MCVCVCVNERNLENGMFSNGGTVSLSFTPEPCADDGMSRRSYPFRCMSAMSCDASSGEIFISPEESKRNLRASRLADEELAFGDDSGC